MISSKKASKVVERCSKIRSKPNMVTSPGVNEIVWDRRK